MKIDVANSITAMQGLGKGEILKITKTKEGIRLVTIKKGKLNFCQRIWQWLGFADTSFSRILKIIQEMQTSHPAEFQNKKFEELSKKVTKYKPIFGKKVKTLVLAKLAPESSSSSEKVKPIPEKVEPLTDKQLERFLTMLGQGKVDEINKELVDEGHQLQFDQFLYSTLNADDEEKAEKFFQPLHKIFPTKEELLKALQKNQATWNQYFIMVFKDKSTFDDIQKELYIIEKNSTPVSEQGDRLEKLLEEFNQLFTSDSRNKLAKPTTEKLVKLLKEADKKKEAAELEIIASFLLEEDPQLEGEAAYAFERFVLQLKHGYQNRQWSLVTQKAQKLGWIDEENNLTTIFTTQKELPRWKILLQDLFLFRGFGEPTAELTFADYIEKLKEFAKQNPEKAKTLETLVRKELNVALIRRAGYLDKESSTATGFKDFQKNNQKLAKLDKESAQEATKELGKELLENFKSNNNISKVYNRFGSLGESSTSPHFFWNALAIGNKDCVYAVLNGQISINKVEDKRKFVQEAEKIPGIPDELSETFKERLDELKKSPSKNYYW